jgi:serine/alanine adding enzyme
MSQFKVTELGQDGQDGQGWQDYVSRSPGASFYHSLEWRDVICRTFGHQARYLVAEQAGAVRGVLPMIEMRSRLFGHFLVSLPFVNYGGILADSPEGEHALANAAVELARRQGASHIELRQSSPPTEPLEGWTLRQHKAALVIPMQGDPKPHWDGLSSRLRGKVRKAEKNGALFTSGGREDLEDFYFLYALNMHNLGTPVYSRTFFENVVTQSGQDVQLLLVRREGRPAAAAISIRQGNRMELPWICQDYGAASFNVNEFLYWKCIERACAQGIAELDLGRSSIDAGTYRFKTQWNPEVRPLHWYYWTAPGRPLPQLSPDNPKYALAVKYWKRIPLAIANRIGPHIVRNIP